MFLQFDVSKYNVSSAVSCRIQSMTELPTIQVKNMNDKRIANGYIKIPIKCHGTEFGEHISQIAATEDLFSKTFELIQEVVIFLRQVFG